ncbi:hypothetical protein Glove_230g11 [Diversispora epigaea]|uniref:Uncharacterized protein n=1 Tax=Diversispora epigaea TaxID=1348612 RepID=A0A397ICL8_9GLOM|nr:hypothetical protein Glove_230g11 [Diversispora epigaea]
MISDVAVDSMSFMVAPLHSLKSNLLGNRNPKPLGSFDDPEIRNLKTTGKTGQKPGRNRKIKGIKMIRPLVWAYCHLSSLAAHNYRER